MITDSDRDSPLVESWFEPREITAAKGLHRISEECVVRIVRRYHGVPRRQSCGLTSQNSVTAKQGEGRAFGVIFHWIGDRPKSQSPWRESKAMMEEQQQDGDSLSLPLTRRT